MMLSGGKKIERSVSAFFEKKGEVDPTKNFEWDYIVVDNDKVVNAWCMPGGKIAVYTGILKLTKNLDALSVVMGLKSHMLLQNIQLRDKVKL